MNLLSSTILFAQTDELARQSVLSWAFSALGPFYGVALPALGFVIFVGACFVVVASHRPAVIAAYLVFVPLPFLIGIFGSIHGFINSYQLVAFSEVTPHPAAVAQGISTGLFSSLVGLLVTFPAYLVIAVGLFVRTCLRGEE